MTTSYWRQRLPRIDPGVVDQDVDCTEPRNCLIGRGPQQFAVADIRFDGEGFAALLADPGGLGFRAGAVHIKERQTRPVFREEFRHAGADSHGRTRHKRGLVL